jgi:hypothetical protein
LGNKILKLKNAGRKPNDSFPKSKQGLEAASARLIGESIAHTAASLKKSELCDN